MDRFCHEELLRELRVQNHHQHLSLHVHFTHNSYSNCHQVKSGYLKSPLTLVSGLNRPSPSPVCILPSRQQLVPPSWPPTLYARLQTCPSRRQDVICHLHLRHYDPVAAVSACRQWMLSSPLLALCARLRPSPSRRHYVPVCGRLRPADSGCSNLHRWHYVPAR